MPMDPTPDRGHPRSPDRDTPRDEHEQGSPPEALDPRQALIEHARQLGATADELQAALDALALQAEAVLHRLRGGRLH